ncbi:sulfite exporter TauE/SafE family protein [Chitinophaga sp. Cy-1792]|uniref:sulfite exporter TauE/SafE family protein n=1 Tax=Chitinophaga sp. Cy-1792 TaxID=2608339 RepID=UPI001420162D|nr:sulfite exporter TauE/SafE family protein [Chitinophaga sp. Cy-1792]NIG57553.1 sulfite exporter TauE/SafE family protein [Chitinophaga sp. Cy-1792]
MWGLIIIFICSIISFLLSAICGGGAGLILIPVLGIALSVSQVPAALSIGTFTSSATRLAAFKKHINWHIVRYFVPAAIPAVWLGAWLLKYLNPVYLEIMMGLFLLSNIPSLLQKAKNESFGHAPNNMALTAIGFAAGFLSGITGAVGVLFNRFYLRYGLTKEEIIATRAANEIILHLIKIILYAYLGLITARVVEVGVLVAIAAVIATWATKSVLPKLSEHLFRKIGYATMVLSGVVMLTSATNNLFASNKGYLNTKLITKGVEANLQWQRKNFSLEFTYDEGFEFEVVIPFAELNATQQKTVMDARPANTQNIIIEAVYTIGETSYEAYYFSNQQLIHKIDFR